MDQAYLVQFAGSAIAIALLAAAAFWARIPRPVQPLTEASARALIAEELPDDHFEQIWIDTVGAAAVGRSGDDGVVLFRVGDSYAVRTAPWAKVRAAHCAKSRAVIRFDDPACPSAAFRLAGAKAPFA